MTVPTGFYDTRPPGPGYGGWNKDQGYNVSRFRQAALDTLGQERGFGSAAEQSGYNAYRSFDPSAAFGQYYSGVLGSTGSALADALTRLQGQAVGMGRLDTGFLDRDQGDTVRRFYADAAAQGQQAALQTAGLRQQQLGNLLQFGTAARDRYLDLLNGNFDRLTAMQNARGPGIGGVLGAVGGGLLGSALGPLGSSLGSRLGSALTGWI